MHGAIVGRAIRLGASYDPNIPGGRANALETVGNRAGPFWRSDQKILGLSAGRAPARRREDVRPHVQHRQQVEFAVRVRRRHDLRVLSEVQPSDRIKRVEVDPHDDLHVGRREGRHVHERVHRTLAKFLAGFNVGRLFSREVHREQRIEINIGLDGDGVRSLSGDGRRNALNHDWALREG